MVGFPGLSLDELELDPEGFAPVRLGGPLLEPLEPPLEGLDMDLVDPILCDYAMRLMSLKGTFDFFGS